MNWVHLLSGLSLSNHTIVAKGYAQRRSVLFGAALLVMAEGIFILEESDKVVLNTGMATWIFQGGEGHLGLAFSSSGVANMVCWKVMDYTCASDHSLIQIELQSYIDYGEIYNSRWVFKRANWTKFSDESDVNMDEIW